MRSSASLRAFAARFFSSSVLGLYAAFAIAGMLLPGPASSAGGVFAYADPEGAWVLRDGPGEPGWRLLLSLDEPGPRTMPATGRMAPACRVAGSISPWRGEVERAAALAGLDPDLIRAVMYVESRCDPRAVSPKGARGLMQLMPATAARYGVMDAFDPAQNLAAGARHLRDLLGAFSGNLELALAAYNAGPRAVVEARMRIPSFRETRVYVPAVLERLRLLRAGESSD